MPVRVIPSATANPLFRRQAEEEEVLRTRLCGHLNGRSVACAYGQCAVKLLTRRSSAEVLDKGGPSLGMFPATEYVCGRTLLQEGDVLGALHGWNFGCP